jgi:hypothetical protein
VESWTEPCPFRFRARFAAWSMPSRRACRHRLLGFSSIITAAGALVGFDSEPLIDLGARFAAIWGTLRWRLRWSDQYGGNTMW